MTRRRRSASAFWKSRSDFERYGLLALVCALGLGVAWLVQCCSGREPTVAHAAQIVARAADSVADTARDVARAQAEEPSPRAAASEPRELHDLHESHDSPGGGRARESREPAARRPDFDFFEPPVRLPGRASVVAPPPPGVKRETRVAIVQPHDTLQKIAQRELGDANQWRAILRSNPGLDPHKLKAGRELVLPIVVREPPKNVEPAARTHVVADGETLQSIALECYGDRARWIDLLEANRDLVRDPSALVVGTKLRIPSP